MVGVLSLERLRVAAEYQWREDWERLVIRSYWISEHVQESIRQLLDFLNESRLPTRSLLRSSIIIIIKYQVRHIFLKAQAGGAPRAPRNWKVGGGGTCLPEPYGSGATDIFACVTFGWVSAGIIAHQVSISVRSLLLQQIVFAFFEVLLPINGLLVLVTLVYLH